MPDETNDTPPAAELKIEPAPGSPQEQLLNGDNSAPISEHPDTSGELEKDFKPINFSAFEQKRQGGTPDVPVTKKPDAPVVQNPPEVKTEGTPVVDPAKKQTQVITRESVLKDLGVPEDQFKNYKFMSNEAFNTVKGVLEENKKLKTAKPAEVPAAAPVQVDYSKTLYGHSEGYLLDNNYRQAQRGVTLCQTAQDHWIQQEEAIARGEQWYDLSVDAQGNLVINPTPIEPTEKGAAHVRGQKRHAEEYLYRYSQNAQQIQQSYGAKHKEDIALLRSAEEKFFPGYEKPDHPTKPAQDYLISLLPESQRANPLTKTLAYTYANNTLLRDTAVKEKQRADAAEAKLKVYEDKEKALGNPQQPTKNNFIPGDGTATKKVFSYADYQRRVNGL